MKKIFFLATLFVVGIMLLTPMTFSAEKFPSREITLICPWAPGGGTDTVSRALTKNAKKYFGVEVNVVNRTGGGGAIGVTAVAQSRPDGYTVGMMDYNTQAMYVQGQTRYTYFGKGLEPLCLINPTSLVISVRSSDDRFKTLHDFVNLAKQKPKTVTVALTLVGDNYHQVLGLFAREYGFEVTVVPFGSAAINRSAMIGGHVDAVITDINEMLPFYKTGEARLLGYTADERHPKFPDVPTFKELGYGKIRGGNNRIIALPAGVPNDRKAILKEGFRGCFNDPDFRALMDELTLVAVWKEGDELQNLIKEYTNNMMVVLKEIGLIK